jgi:biotin carboxyl carrier protein
MQRRFRVTVEGRDYDVTVEEISDDTGGLYPDRATMRAAAPRPARSSAAPADVPGKRPTQSKPAAGPGDVVSPLAGLLLSIDVAMGATVEADTQVATLEAMKTKTLVKAGRSGKVTDIAVKAGQAVEAGQVLITIG